MVPKVQSTRAQFAVMPTGEDYAEAAKGVQVSRTIAGRPSPSGKVLFAKDAVYVRRAPDRANAHVVQQKLEALAALPREDLCGCMRALADLEKELE